MATEAYKIEPTYNEAFKSRKLVGNTQPFLQSDAGSSLKVKYGTTDGAEFDDKYVTIKKSLRRVRSAQQKNLEYGPAPKSVEEVPGVVSKISDEMATISCQLPNDSAEIDVPLDLLPAESSQYGAAVWVSVDKTAPIRRLSIRQRHGADVAQVELGERAAKIQMWLEQD